MNPKLTASILLAGVALLGGGALLQPSTFTTADDIGTAETTYHDKTGKYLQVLPTNELPLYEKARTADKATVKDQLGNNLPPGYRVDVYETPKGEHGYAVSWQDATGSYSKGYGPEAADWTWNRPTVATTTP